MRRATRTRDTPAHRSRKDEDNNNGERAHGGERGGRAGRQRGGGGPQPNSVSDFANRKTSLFSQFSVCTIPSFLPYTRVGALCALDLARGSRASRAPTAAATALYACPLFLLAATGDAHAAVSSTFLCAAHFTAENVLRGADAADAPAADAPADDVAQDVSSNLAARLYA